MRDLKVLSFSPKQKCFHVEDLNDYLRINGEMLLRGDEPQYYAVKIFVDGEHFYDHAEEVFKRVLSERWIENA